MLTEITKAAEMISKMGKSQRDKQTMITTAEVASIWDILTSRYDISETTTVMLEFAKDTEFKYIIKQGEKLILNEISMLENLIHKYGIPSPSRPSVSPVSIIDTEVVTDKYIFRHILSGIQSFFPVLIHGFTHSISADIRTMFQNFLIDETKIYNEFLTYGVMKGWVNSPPAFRQ